MIGVGVAYFVIVLIVFEFGLVVELIVELIVSRYFAVMLIV